MGKNLQSTLENTKECTADKKGCSSGQEGLATGDQTPADHLNWNPTVRSQLLRDQLWRKFSEQKEEIEDGLPCIIVIGSHIQVHQHIVRKSLDNIATVQLQGEKCQAGKRMDTKVDLKVPVRECEFLYTDPELMR